MLGISRNERRIDKIVLAIQQLFVGRTRSTGTFSCTASAASTVVTNETVNNTDTVLLMPMTANAAAEIGAGTAYVSAVAKGSFTVTHASAVSTDRTFRYLAMGGEG
jgi:hypothetical protein